MFVTLLSAMLWLTRKLTIFFSGARFMFKWTSLFGIVILSGGLAFAHPHVDVTSDLSDESVETAHENIENLSSINSENSEGEDSIENAADVSIDEVSIDVEAENSLDEAIDNPSDDTMVDELADAEKPTDDKWMSLENLAETMAAHIGEKIENFEDQDDKIVERHLGDIDLDDAEFFNFKGGPIITDGDSLREVARAFDRVVAERRTFERYSDLVLGFLEEIEVTQNEGNSYSLTMFDRNVGHATLVKNKIGIPHRLEIEGLNHSIAISQEQIKGEAQQGVRLILDIYDTAAIDVGASDKVELAGAEMGGMPKKGVVELSTSVPENYDNVVGSWTSQQRQIGYGISDITLELSLGSDGKPAGLISTQPVDISECDEDIYVCDISRCEGLWELESKTEGTLVFRETVLGGNCVDGQVIITPETDGQLSYEFIDSEDDENITTGTFKRVKTAKVASH